jgi:hypothetical protein
MVLADLPTSTSDVFGVGGGVLFAVIPFITTQKSTVHLLQMWIEGR